MISPEHLVDLERQVQINFKAPNDTQNRRIKRGAKGERTVRPNPAKFTNCDNFILERQTEKHLVEGF